MTGHVPLVGGSDKDFTREEVEANEGECFSAHTLSISLIFGRPI